MKHHEHEDPGALLTEQEEKLLGRYFDGCASRWEAFRAQRLLKRSPQAVAFLDSLAQVRAVAQHAASEQPPVDLWSRISQRIDQEERAELLLGRRVLDDSSRSSRPRVSIFGTNAVDRIGWGLTGGVVAASLTFFVIDNYQGTSEIPKFSSSIASVAPLAGVSRSSPIQLASSNSASRSDPHALEVDWVRSDGRVRLMHDPGERSPIIWVKRRQIFKFPRNPNRSGRRLPTAASTGIGERSTALMPSATSTR